MPRVIRCVTTVALVGLVLSGCSASPTSTVLRPDGTEATVAWADYPGTADQDAAAVLAGPREADVEAIADTLFADIAQALDAEYDFTWSTSGEEGWYPASGNGYGGEGGYITYNSESFETDSVPSSTADWKAILDRISAVTDSSGLGPVILDHEAFPDDADDYSDRFGTDDPDEYWMWTATASENSQWMYVVIVDVDRDPTGKAAEEYSSDEGEGRMIGVGYGATTIPDDGLDAFLTALEPFEGLKKPPATHSD